MKNDARFVIEDDESGDSFSKGFKREYSLCSPILTSQYSSELLSCLKDSLKYERYIIIVNQKNTTYILK